MNAVHNTLDFYTTEQTYPGQIWMWAIYPFPGNYTESVRVNLLIDNTQKPPVYSAPIIEISPMRVAGPAELRQIRSALDQAELKALEWADYTGEPAHE